MIRLIFNINRETFKVEIDKRQIWYLDRKWDKTIRLIPPDEGFIKKIIMSRNKIPSYLANLFILTEKEKEEYRFAKNDEELAEICIQDCKMKGAKLLKRENG